MSQTEMERFVAACDYPGILDERAVEESLREYLAALGITRKIVRLGPTWGRMDQPSLAPNVNATLVEFAQRSGQTRAASDASAAREALDALNARAARDARAALEASDASDAGAAREARDARDASAARATRFASWRAQEWWYWSWDLSWIAITYLGARQNNALPVIKWSKPIFDAFIAGAWVIYWTDNVLFWVTKPRVHRERWFTGHRLHNENYAAVESDVENLYFWHGVLVPAFVIARPEWITIDHIDSETNAEVRRVMIERYHHGAEFHGPAAFIRFAGGERLDHDERFGTLWRRKIPGDEHIVMLEVVNATREPDGDFKRYWLRVPPNMITAREAVAWTFDVEPENYAVAVET
jgi:hypothetical protein